MDSSSVIVMWNHDETGGSVCNGGGCGSIVAVGNDTDDFFVVAYAISSNISVFVLLYWRITMRTMPIYHGYILYVIIVTNVVAF